VPAPMIATSQERSDLGIEINQGASEIGPLLPTHLGRRIDRHAEIEPTRRRIFECRCALHRRYAALRLV
jgi:hypothetical protein